MTTVTKMVTMKTKETLSLMLTTKITRAMTAGDDEDDE